MSFVTDLHKVWLSIGPPGGAWIDLSTLRWLGSSSDLSLWLLRESILSLVDKVRLVQVLRDTRRSCRLLHFDRYRYRLAKSCQILCNRIILIAPFFLDIRLSRYMMHLHQLWRLNSTCDLPLTEVFRVLICLMRGLWPIINPDVNLIVIDLMNMCARTSTLRWSATASHRDEFNAMSISGGQRVYSIATDSLS